MSVSTADFDVISFADDNHVTHRKTRNGAVDVNALDRSSVTQNGFASSSKTGRPKHRFGHQVLNVKNLCFDIDEQSSLWWQKLVQFQMPWEYLGGKNSVKKRVLNDVTLQVKSGELMAVLGGSGKNKLRLYV